MSAASKNCQEAEATNDSQSSSPAFQDETEAGASKGQSSTPLIGYKRRLSKQIVIRGQRPSDIDSNEETSAADLGEREVPDGNEPRPKHQRTGPEKQGMSCQVVQVKSRTDSGPKGSYY